MAWNPHQHPPCNFLVSSLFSMSTFSSSRSNACAGIASSSLLDIELAVSTSMPRSDRQLEQEVKQQCRTMGHRHTVSRAARVLDIVLSSQKEFVDNVVIQEPLGSSDHNQLHFNINIKSDKTKVKQCRRDFRRGNYDEIRKSLALIDWNDKMNNKTATECWNILRGELDSAIDSYVPMKKQGKRSKKKHLSKEAQKD